MSDHSHVFGQDQVRPGERRALWVIAITAAMMVIEITAGIAYGSMALLADGMHMASHATALAIAAFAYIYARRHAHDRRYTFGTGKVNALGGFAGAVLLAAFALLMAYESVERLLWPTAISFNQAIFVAVLGLLVNGLCVAVLGHHHHGHDHDEHHHHHHDGNHHHDHEDEHHEHHDHQHRHHEHHAHDHSHAHHADHNLHAAYLHVLADALTSVTAIAALVAGKFLGWGWMDPLMGIVGSLLVARWSLGLLRITSAVLLDHQAPANVTERVRATLEADHDVRVTDLHIWSIGPAIHAAEIGLLTPRPQPASYYKALLPDELHLVHVTIEVTAATTGTVADFVEPSSAAGLVTSRSAP